MTDMLQEVRQIEGMYVDRVKAGSKDMGDYTEVNYFSGLRNGIQFMKHILENQVLEGDFDKMVKEILHQGSIN